MITMIGDLLGELVMQLIFELLLLGFIALLVSMGLSEDQAYGVFFLLGLIAIFRVIVWEKRRRELLGKAVDLDLDGDGKISEEEWAAAEMGENEWWSEEETAEAEAEKSIVKAQDSALPPPPKTQARKDRDLALFLAGLIVFLMWLTS